MSQAHKDTSKYVVGIAFFAAIAGLLFGFDTGVISGALQFIQANFHIPSEQKWLLGSIVAAVPFGALLGAINSGRSSVLLGRRTSIMVTAALFVVGALVVSGAMNVAMVIIGRLIMGFAVGLSSMIVPMYLSEIAPAKIRGAIVFLYQLTITLGLFMAFVINYVFADSANWRMMFFVGVVPAVILGIGMWFLPYSPRWLLLKGREQQAQTVLQRLRGSVNVEQELAEIRESLQHAKGRFRDLFSKQIRPLVAVAFFLFVFQQLSGINTILYYAPNIFQHIGYQVDGAILASVATGLTLVIATIIGIAIVDTLGRRRLFILGFVGMIVSLVMLGLSFDGLFELAWRAHISLIAVLAFILFFGISLGPLCYLFMSELFPLKIKGPGMAVASCANWSSNMLVSLTFLPFANWVGMGNTMLFYGFCTMVGLLFIIFFVPETKGVTLESIERHLYEGKPLRQLGLQ